ncbi:signaling protein without kinase domain [Flavobacteriales bacterium ALC-1]|nr:signaling protein without kinase domain [Flavobacteriales bacterium ALC-1]
MSKLDRLIDNKVVQNISVWIFIYLIGLVSIQSDNVVLSAFLGVIFLAVPVYIHNLKILPLFFSNRKWLGLVLFILNIAVFTCVGLYFLSDALDHFEWRMVYNMIGILILVLFVSSALKVASDSFTRRQQEKDAELKLLKAQLNPHFLFNTLNNLYGLSVVKSDKLPNLMLKLSDLLRYSLYDTKDKFVPLEKEITYLENYMSLENIRLEDKTNIEFTKNGTTTNKVIAPMLLIVFVENAFKHIGNNKDQESLVHVDLAIEAGVLKFKCTNSFDPLSKKVTNMEKGKSGIGLQNAKKRLSLIYPEQHELRIQEQDAIFNVDLTLQLV